MTETLVCDHSKSYRAVLSCGTADYVVHGSLTQIVIKTLTCDHSNESY